MDEHVLAASVGLNKPITLCRVEPLHGTYRHVRSPQLILKHAMLVTEIRRKKGPASGDNGLGWLDAEQHLKPFIAPADAEPESRRTSGDPRRNL
jgi:hypothetical protein